MDNKVLIYGGIAAAAYFLFIKPSGTSIINPTGAPGVPGTPVNTGNIPTTYGVNGGYTGNYAAVVSNYNTLIQADPNLSNPNYQLSPSEAQQYAANYADISQGVATWPGGLSQKNLQKHWTLYGCAQKRIFLPLVPPSAAPYVATVQNNPKSSGGGGSSWVGPAITTAGMIVVALLGVDDTKLNNAECQLLFTGSAIMKDILPFYALSNRIAVNEIQGRLDDLLTQYA